MAFGICAVTYAASSNGAFSPATGESGMVSSAHPLATEAGLDLLKAGGNAFDAAIAVASTLNVVEPQNSGIGGYGIILIYDANADRVRVLNCSGRFPMLTDSDVFRAPYPDHESNRRSARAISTPTNLNAWQALWNEYGSAPWPRLFDSAIRLAAKGHPINASLARSIRGAAAQMSEYSKAFYTSNGQPLEEGDVLIQRDLARSFRLIARNGAGALYGGEIGRALVATAETQGSFLRMADLLANEAEWWEPIGIDYRGYRVYTASPPGNSFSSLVRLGIMERFDLPALGHNSVEYLHRFAEVTKHAYWTRLKYAGDPDVQPPPLDMLLSEDYFDAQFAAIDLDTATEFVPPGVSGAAGEHTTHFVVADRDGNIVSATQTLGGGFGSKVMVEGRGIWLNNSMYFCTFEPKGNPMDAHAGRRKLNSNHPTIVYRNGKPWIAIGTPGGHTIGQTVPQMIMNMLDFEMDVQNAIAAPRISFVEPDVLSVEDRVPRYVRDGLEAMGHHVRVTEAIGNGHGLTIEYGEDGRPQRFTGGADPRGRGQARGY
jgi:gamma-glutamyltranspeptidase/glutathione hydrolase